MAAILALLHWRLALCLVGAVVIALVLSSVFVELTAEHGIAFVLLAAAVGLYWQSRSQAGVGMVTSMPEPAISRPVALLGLSFVGLIWGGIAYELLKSELLSATALVLSVGVVALWYGRVLRRPIPRQTLVLSAGALLFGFGGLVAAVRCLV